MQPRIKVPWLTPKVQAVGKEDMFHKQNVYNYYQPSHDLPLIERSVYNPYGTTRHILESKRDGKVVRITRNGKRSGKEMRITRNGKNLCKIRGGCIVKPYRDMIKRNRGGDTSLSNKDFFNLMNEYE